MLVSLDVGLDGLRSVSPCFANGAFCCTANRSRREAADLILDVTVGLSALGSSIFLLLAREGCSVMCDMILWVGVVTYFFFIFRCSDTIDVPSSLIGQGLPARDTSVDTPPSSARLICRRCVSSLHLGSGDVYYCGCRFLYHLVPSAHCASQYLKQTMKAFPSRMPSEFQN